MEWPKNSFLAVFEARTVQPNQHKFKDLHPPPFPTPAACLQTMKAWGAMQTMITLQKFVSDAIV